MKHFRVTGMSCAACSARVESAVGKVPGVTQCAVSLLTNSMTVDGTASDADIIRAVTDAGYGAACTDGPVTENAAADASVPDLTDHETPRMRRRLYASLGFLLLLMYVGMGHHMLGLPIPAFMQGNPFAVSLTQLLLCAAVMVINQKFFVNGFRGLWHRAPNMDTLVATGSAASFLYSIVTMYGISLKQIGGDVSGAAADVSNLYFESAAMILVLITVGKLLESKSKGRTTDALASLIRMAPQTARLWQDGAETEVPVTRLRVGDCFVLRPGDSVPVDGEVLEGESAVDESALTGESIPVDKVPGSTVSAATINGSGRLVCRASRVGGDTTHAQIIRLMSDAAASKAPISRLADRVAGVFVPVVMGIALLTFVIWLLIGETVGTALVRGISVLVVSCPCALGLATPVAVMAGNGNGAKHGILFKTAAALEAFGKSEIVVLDKTGTLTVGKPALTGIHLAEGVSEQELLEAAQALEQGSEHPLAHAVVTYAEENGLQTPPAQGVAAQPGYGVTGLWQQKEAFVGSRELAARYEAASAALEALAERIAKTGAIPLFVGVRGKALGVLAVSDRLKSDSADAVSQLRKLGARVVLLSGDREETARMAAESTGIEEVIAHVLPHEKAGTVTRLKKQGAVLMVGDGINDAPALASADLGCAIGSGTDVAIDAADVVLMNSRLTDVSAAVRLSRAVLRIIRENLCWALCYNLIGIPLAAGAFVKLLGWQLSPMFGAAAMSISSFAVVTNALRLNHFDPYDGRHDRPLRVKHRKENKTMEKTLKIEGMMCPHCEARVKQALEALPEVDEAVVSHVSGTAVVTLNAQVGDDLLKNTVEAQGYKVL